MNRKSKWAIGAVSSLIVVGAGTGVAFAAGGNSSDPTSDDVPLTGTTLQKASQAALAFTGGGSVTGTEVGDEESLYEVEVTLADGRQTDVQLDDAFAVVGSKTDAPGADTEPDAPGN